MSVSLIILYCYSINWGSSCFCFKVRIFKLDCDVFYSCFNLFKKKQKKLWSNINWRRHLVIELLKSINSQCSTAADQGSPCFRRALTQNWIPLHRYSNRNLHDIEMFFSFVFLYVPKNVINLSIWFSCNPRKDMTEHISHRAAVINSSKLSMWLANSKISAQGTQFSHKHTQSLEQTRTALRT